MSIYAAASGMVLEQRRQEMIARNLVGSEIAGFKREFISSHNFKADLDRERMENTNRYQGTSGGEEHVDFTQGALKNTNDPLDFGLHGEGYFEVENIDGQTLYTRNGQFSLNRDGVLITNNGDIVQGIDGPIQLNPEDHLSDLYASPKGELIIDSNVDGQHEKRLVGQLKVVEPTDNSILRKISSSQFTLIDEKDQDLITEVDYEAADFAVKGGYLETSNASPITDMVTMVQSMREFEMGQKMLKQLGEMGKQARQKLG